VAAHCYCCVTAVVGIIVVVGVTFARVTASGVNAVDDIFVIVDVTVAGVTAIAASLLLRRHCMLLLASLLMLASQLW
jgi:hypothetical protein